MFLACAVLVFSLGLLIWGAERFISGAAGLAKVLDLPAMLIGIVIVGFGTSTPELLVSLFAAIEGKGSIAVANAVGSNIGNIGFILGLTAFLAPITVQSRFLKSEVPQLLFGTCLAVVLLADGECSRVDAGILLGVFTTIVGLQIFFSRNRKDDPFAAETAEEFEVTTMSIKKAARLVGLGLILMMVCSKSLIWSAATIAHGFGVSERLIGLTIVSLGTSMPELVSSLVASRKGENELVFGNVIGSNLFNILAVLGIAGMTSPMAFDGPLLVRDGLVMIGFTVALLVVGFGRFGNGRINRWEGGAVLMLYLGYTAFLIASG